MKITIEPIAFVINRRHLIQDDEWGDVISDVQLVSTLSEESLRGLETFSHVEVIFYFDKVAEEKIQYGSRHPRNNTLWPQVGIFAQRGKNRPNRLGATIAKVIERKGNILTLQGLDAIDGTPVLDIKPVMQEFLPREEIQQPRWSKELMQNYW